MVLSSCRLFSQGLRQNDTNHVSLQESQDKLFSIISIVPHIALYFSLLHDI